MLVEKRSQAVKIWCAVLVVILSLIYFQTRNYQIKESNLLIDSNADAVGGKVYVDGNERGVLTASDHLDVGGAQFRDKLSAGSHLIEVRKQGFKPFSENIPMKLEAFIHVVLEPEEH